MEMLEALSQAFDHANKVVAAVGPDQMDAPTPCREWTVRDLLAHTTGVVINMGRGAAGDPELLTDANALALDADFASQFRTETDRTLTAWTARGLEGDLDIGAGRPIPATAGISINLLDTATHSWDVARATGQAAELPDELASYVLDLARGVVPDNVRGSRGFDPAVTVGHAASPTDQLVAFLGRRP